MSQDYPPRNMTNTILLMVFVPLLVTVVGGLLVEYLKPAQSYTPLTTQDVSLVKAAPASTSLAAPIKKMLVRRWYIVERPTIYGDLEVEFTEYGQIVRTYFRKLIPDDVTTYHYEITDNGEVKTDGKLNLRLVKVTSDELILSWDGTVAHYKRGWYWWEITLMAVGAVLVIAICVVLKARFG